MSPVDVLSGLRVHEVRWGWQVSIVASDENWVGDDVRLVIDFPCLVREPNGSEHRFDRSAPETFVPLLSLQGRFISRVSVEDGTLQAVFDDGSMLVVPPHDEYEAWQIEGPGDQLTVCLPGGDLY